MQLIRSALLLGVGFLVVGEAGPLNVLRVTPSSPADPQAEISVTFDRPVAGGLDSTLDPHGFFRIEPEVSGVLEWRDPVTLRFAPEEPLEPGRTYEVTILPTFQAMDGSRLEGEFRASIEVSPPRVLGGHPVGPSSRPRFLGPNPIFSVVLSAPAAPSSLADRARITLGKNCGARVVSLRAHGEPRRIRAEDPGSLRYLGRWRASAGDTLRDLRRVIDLTPASPLPPGCRGILSLPEFTTGEGVALTWAFETHGALRLKSAGCSNTRNCPIGPLSVAFSTPVQGSEILRHVSVTPEVDFTVSDTAEARDSWWLQATLAPHTRYRITVDPALRDILGQSPEGPLEEDVVTTGWSPSVSYQWGRMLVEGEGLRTLAVQHVNVDTLEVTTLPVPASLEAGFLARRWGWREGWEEAAHLALRDTLVVDGTRDERMITGVRFPIRESGAGPDGTLMAVKIGSPALDSAAQANRPMALVQVTDLAITARVGVEDGSVWVTGVQDGMPRPRAQVTLYEDQGRPLAAARTDEDGIATLDDFHPYEDRCQGWHCVTFEGYVAASLGEDRSLVGISGFDPDLCPWRFNVSAAWGEDRAPVAVAAFTERGIYRPGEPLYAKAIVRRGALGSLAPPRGDSVRFVFLDREGGILHDTVSTLGAFGTADHRWTIPAGLPLGWYRMEVHLQRDGQWRSNGTVSYQIAEYRPPEFLVDVVGEDEGKMAGDSAAFHVSARYLFGAPMGNARLSWTFRQRTLSPWALRIPGVDGFQIGVAREWWEDYRSPRANHVGQGTDTLDASGSWDGMMGVTPSAEGRPARATFTATVTDVNRQIASASAHVTVHPAAFYLGLRQRAKEYFWTAGEPVDLDIVAVDPDGTRVPDVIVEGTVVRREWHRVRRVRQGRSEAVGGWVTDTVANFRVRTAEDSVSTRFTPPAGGSYSVRIQARDQAGREVATTLRRWATGNDWVPWNDESQFKMDVIPDKTRYGVGDTATVFFATPFTDAEAWITVERERVLEQRRIRITSGATTLRLPITEAFAPNVFVGIVVVRGRSAEPGPLDDPGRPTLRVGYAELRVTPEVKRLSVDVEPVQPEYRPGEEASFRVDVRDGEGVGQRAEVTLWAVDEGVLALTGYRTPDPIDLLYPARGLGMRLASNLVSVAPQIPEGQKGYREPGGGGGADLTGVLRSRFQTTAFFLGSVVTDEEGRGEATATLPDNVTTFRVMAVAVTEGDRYGSGESEILVTRPLLARPALPRFIREGDRFSAGVVVNSRMGGRPKVRVDARVTGVDLIGAARRTERLAVGRGAEFRFDFRGLPGDSSRFVFHASGGGEEDAVLTTLPIRPNYHPLTATRTGVLRDSTFADFPLSGDVDPGRSRVEISLGSSPLTFILGAHRRLSVYPYGCTEQVSSAALPLIALLQAEQSLDGEAVAPEGAEEQVNTAIETILRRQRSDGGIGYWGGDDWSTPWLSAYAGRVLLEARSAGLVVPDTALTLLAGYMKRSVSQGVPTATVVSRAWGGDPSHRLAEKVAALSFLSRLGQPEVAAENSMMGEISRLRWADRLTLAMTFARRGDRRTSWGVIQRVAEDVRVEGRRAVLPDSIGGRHYFRSGIRPAAILMEALLALDPSNSLVGPLAETLAEGGRASGVAFPRNTQDFAYSVLALARYETARRAFPPGRVRIRSSSGPVVELNTGGPTSADTTLSLDGMVIGTGGQTPALRLALESDGGAPVYYVLTVHEVPEGVQLTPVDRGLQVERWYESVETGEPIVSAAEGEVVRVRVRIHVPSIRYFVVLDDPLPAGLEPVDLSLRTLSPFGATLPSAPDMQRRSGWYFGSWDSGIWSPFDHKELRDDRVVYSATVLWPGSYSASYLARATTAGTFLYPPAHAEEMYNPGVNGRTGGGEFTVTRGGEG